MDINKIKKYIKITQNRNIIFINGFLKNDNLKVLNLLFRSRDEQNSFKVKPTSQYNDFSFNINLIEFNKMKKIDGVILDLYLVVSVPQKVINRVEQFKKEYCADEFIDENGIECFKFIFRFGKFRKTEINELKPIEINGISYHMYTTIKGNISFSICEEIIQQPKIQINKLKSKTTQTIIKAKLFTHSHTIERIKLVLLGRNSNLRATIPIQVKHLKKETNNYYGLNRYILKSIIDFKEIFSNEEFNSDIYDPFVEIKFYNKINVELLRVGNPRYIARTFLKESKAIRDEIVFAITPYYTFKKQNLSFQVDDFEKESYLFLRKMLRWGWVYRLFNKRENIWIVGEKTDKAQDTGFHFFKYVRDNHPRNNVYYVIDKNSKDLNNVIKLGNVLYYKSKEHIEKVIKAKRIISSHHADYLYPLRTKRFNKKIKAKKVFIQHGVMGTKNMVANYGKESPGFNTDLFIVSSDFEKEMIVNDFGYNKNHVHVTGLSRFDGLFIDDIIPKKQVLIIPTWRDWLVREEVFLESEYFERYSELIRSEKLKLLTQKYNFKVVFCLHPNMQKFTQHFNYENVEIIQQGEIDVQTLLKESAMMITDYSSVAFDFSFLNKPIIYYQFDRDRFIGSEGSHLDLDRDLPGDILYEKEDILKCIETYALSNFKMKEKNRIKSTKFLKYRDTNSSKRIYEILKKKIYKDPVYKRVFRTNIFKAIFNRFRKSKYYFPTMKLFYNIARKVLPVDKKLILFESGIGRHYSDSPKCIYDEITRRNINCKKIWVYNKNVRFNDINTKRIKRLSPSYYYYLARAGIWVNNQNFPTYIKKRKQTVYIQTWHGTPLKKMLFDIENIMGRSDDYLQRVGEAVKTWDYLISPSKYATSAFKSAFKYSNKFLEIGYPRNDIFYKVDNSQTIKNIRLKFRIPENKKIILYAPTFRDNQTTGKNKFKFDIPMNLYDLRDSIGNDYVLLLRMHIVISNKLSIEEELKDFVINVSSYNDIQELLVASDILITDYSSVMFDFANTRRPMLFYTYDLETYRDDIRGFYMNFEEEAPGPLIKTTKELTNKIKSINEIEEKYRIKYKNFYNTYCSLEDGYASKRVVDILEKLI